jgi:hypothetical protein
MPQGQTRRDVVVHADNSAAQHDSPCRTEYRGRSELVRHRHDRGTLGGRFHQRRLRLVASQVDAAIMRRVDLPVARAPHYRRSHVRYIVSGETAFADPAATHGQILDDPLPCHRATGPEARTTRRPLPPHLRVAEHAARYGSRIVARCSSTHLPAARPEHRAKDCG